MSDVANEVDESKADRWAYFPFYVDDWAGGTLAFTLEQEGFFLRFIRCQWARKGPLPDDVRWLAGALRSDPRTVRRLRQFLLNEGKIIASGGVLFNPRMKREIKAKLAKDRAKIGPTSAEDRAKIAGRSGEDRAKIGANFSENPIKSTKVATSSLPPDPYPDPEPSPTAERGHHQSTVGNNSKTEDLSSEAGTDGADETRLPFSKAALEEIIDLDGIDLDGLIARFFAVASKKAAEGKPIRDASKYLVSMAYDDMAKSRQITVAQLKRLRSRDQRTRVTEMANVVGAFSKPTPSLEERHKRYNAARAAAALDAMAGKTFTSQAEADKAFESAIAKLYWGRRAAA